MKPKLQATNDESTQKLTDSWNGCDNLAKLELVKDGCLTSGIKTNHQNSHFFLGKKPAEKLCECQPHCSFWLQIPTHLQRPLTYIETNSHHQYLSSKPWNLIPHNLTSLFYKKLYNKKMYLWVKVYSWKSKLINT